MLETDYRTALSQLLESATRDLQASDDAMHALKADIKEAIGVDRRRFHRFEAWFEGVMDVIGGWPDYAASDRRHVVQVFSVSRSGIGFLHATQLYPEDEVAIWLPMRRLVYSVRRCRRLDAQCYLVGATLADGAG